VSQPPPLKHFKFLIQQLQTSTPKFTPVLARPAAADELMADINKILYDAHDDAIGFGFSYTKNRHIRLFFG